MHLHVHFAGRILHKLHVVDSKQGYYRTSSVSRQDEPNPALWLATQAGKVKMVLLYLA